MKSFFLHAICIIYLLCFPVSAPAALESLDNAELDQVTGYAGISFAVKDVLIFQNIGNYRYYASDGGYLSINNLVSDVMKFNPSTDMITGIIHMDVGVLDVASEDDYSGTPAAAIKKGMLAIGSDNWEQEISYHSDSFVFSNDIVAYDLGELFIGPIRKSSWQYYTAPHGTGVDFEYDFEMHIDRLAYTYQPATALALAIDNLHIGQSFGADDPSDPSLWNPDLIGEFKIGDMFGDLAANEYSRPGMIDAGVRQFEPGGDFLGFVRLSLPMTGSIRFEKAEFGAVDFGPGAIDGIKAYRMDAYLIP